jgi:hypothetical protein
MQFFNFKEPDLYKEYGKEFEDYKNHQLKTYIYAQFSKEKKEYFEQKFGPYIEPAQKKRNRNDN